jgi:hypothetical protein
MVRKISDLHIPIDTDGLSSVHNITKEEEKDPTNHRIYAFYVSSNQLCRKAACGPLDSSHLRSASQTFYFQMGQRGCSNWVDRRGFLQIYSAGMCHSYSCYYNTPTCLYYQGENTLHALPLCSSRTHQSQISH